METHLDELVHQPPCLSPQGQAAVPNSRGLSGHLDHWQDDCLNLDFLLNIKCVPSAWKKGIVPCDTGSAGLTE